MDYYSQFVPIYVCPKCGRISGRQIKKCMICETPPVKYEPELNWIEVCQWTSEDRDELRLKFQPREKYDNAAWTHRVKMFNGWEANGHCWANGFDYRYRVGVNHVECPYCHQYWTTKIGTGARLLSVGLFGLGSKKVGKQWHCHFCNSDF